METPKTLVALETNCSAKYAERRAFAEQTWGRRMPPGYTFESFDGPRLDVDDSYPGLCQKTQAICQWAAERDFDYLIKVDDDVYVRTERLKIPDADYAGHCLPRLPETCLNYCAGCFYWLSRKAFTIIAEAPFRPEWTSAEDQWVGWTLRQHGILPVGLPEVVLEPCLCGNCVPDSVPAEWTAYSKWIKWSPDLFREFERRYSSFQL